MSLTGTYASSAVPPGNSIRNRSARAVVHHRRGIREPCPCRTLASSAVRLLTLFRMQPQAVLETIVYCPDLAAGEAFYRDVVGLVAFTRYAAAQHLLPLRQRRAADVQSRRHQHRAGRGGRQPDSAARGPRPGPRRVPRTGGGHLAAGGTGSGRSAYRSSRRFAGPRVASPSTCAIRRGTAWSSPPRPCGGSWSGERGRATGRSHAPGAGRGAPPGATRRGAARFSGIDPLRRRRGRDDHATRHRALQPRRGGRGARGGTPGTGRRAPELRGVRRHDHLGPAHHRGGDPGLLRAVACRRGAGSGLGGDAPGVRLAHRRAVRRHGKRLEVLQWFTRDCR